MLSWHKAGRLSCKKEWMHPKNSAFLLCFPQTWVVYPSRETWIKVDYIAQFGMKRNIHKDVGRGTREPPKIWANNTDSNALEFFSPEIQETKLPGKARQKGISMCNSRGTENHLYFRLSHLKAVSFRKGQPLQGTSISRDVWKNTSNGNFIPSWPVPAPDTPVSPQPPPVALSSSDILRLHAQGYKIPFPCHVLHFVGPFYSWKAQKWWMFSRNIPALPYPGNKWADSSNIFYIFSLE